MLRASWGMSLRLTTSGRPVRHLNDCDERGVRKTAFGGVCSAIQSQTSTQASKSRIFWSAGGTGFSTRCRAVLDSCQPTRTSAGRQPPHGPRSPPLQSGRDHRHRIQGDRHRHGDVGQPEPVVAQQFGGDERLVPECEFDRESRDRQQHGPPRELPDAPQRCHWLHQCLCAAHQRPQCDKQRGMPHDAKCDLLARQREQREMMRQPLEDIDAGRFGDDVGRLVPVSVSAGRMPMSASSPPATIPGSIDSEPDVRRRSSSSQMPPHTNPLQPPTSG